MLKLSGCRRTKLLQGDTATSMAIMILDRITSPPILAVGTATGCRELGSDWLGLFRSRP